VITQTEVESGVTADEVEKMLEKNADDEETQNKVAQVLAQKENDDLKAENENLKAQLDSYQSYDIDMKRYRRGACYRLSKHNRSGRRSYEQPFSRLAHNS